MNKRPLKTALIMLLCSVFMFQSLPYYASAINEDGSEAFASTGRYDAEHATTTGNAAFTNEPVEGGEYAGPGYISFFSEGASSATFHIQAERTELYELSIGYYAPYGSKGTTILVNGAGNGEFMLPAPEDGEVSAEADISKILLEEGENTITFTRGWGYYGIEYIIVKPVNPSLPTLFIEAEEDYTATGNVTVATEIEGYSGTGYLFNQDGTIHWDVSSPETSIYEVTVAYSAPHGDKQTTLTVNGQGTVNLDMKETEVFVELDAGIVSLDEGENRLTLHSGWGWYNIDYIKLVPVANSDPEPHQVEKTLVNPDASPEARALINYLVDQYGNKILSGQTELKDVKWIYEQVGKYPAVMAVDFMDYSPSRVVHGTTGTAVEEAIEWAEMGGIITFHWHWNAPKDLLNVPGNEWWSGFYTRATTFDVEYALANRESEDFQLLISDMDVIAEQLKRLQAENIPVLWRPLHEAEGGWFWWGAKGPEAAIELYRLMYDRYTNHHKLNNLIWMWNSEAEEWYPGDDVVDMISTDIYNPVGDFSPSINKYEHLKELVQDKKLVALPETGIIPDPDQLQLFNANWSWFATWTGDYIRNGIYNPLEHLQKVFYHDYVITLDELPENLSSYGLPEGVWTKDASLSVKTRTTSEITVDWSNAIQNESVKNFKLYKDGEEIATVEGNVQEYTFTGLLPGTQYTIKVEALDQEDRWSANGPSTVVSTLSNASSPPVYYPPVVPPAEPVEETSEGVYTLSEDDVSSQDGVLEVSLDPTVTKLIIPSALAGTLGEDLKVGYGDAWIVIPNQWLGGNSHELVLEISRLSSQDVEDNLSQADSSLHGSLQAQSGGYSFELWVRDADGMLSKMAIDQRVTLSLPLVSGGTRNLAGVYHIGEDNGPRYLMSESSNGYLTVPLNDWGTYAVLTFTPSFVDMNESHWAFQAAQWVSAHHLLGRHSGTFGPNELMTREDFVRLLSIATNLDMHEGEPNGSSVFEDVSVNDDNAAYILAAYHAGIIKGDEAGQFLPDGNLSRQEMAAMLARAIRYVNNEASSSVTQHVYEDQDIIPQWAAHDIAYLADIQVLQGVGDNTFAPSLKVTRAQAAQAIGSLRALLGD